METLHNREAWNQGKLIGQKPPLKPKDIWAIRFHLQSRHAIRDLAMFNLAVDSKLRVVILSACMFVMSPTGTRFYLGLWWSNGKCSDRFSSS